MKSLSVELRVSGRVELGRVEGQVGFEQAVRGARPAGAARLASRVACAEVCVMSNLCKVARRRSNETAI